MMNVLLIEDEPDLYELLHVILEMWGYTVTAFADGEDALNWISQVEADSDQASNLPQLAVIDIRLPGNISGDVVVSHLRRHRAFEHIVIVLITAYRLSPKDEKRMYELGANEIIYKPLPAASVMKAKLDHLLAIHVYRNN